MLKLPVEISLERSTAKVRIKPKRMLHYNANEALHSR